MKKYSKSFSLLAYFALMLTLTSFGFGQNQTATIRVTVLNRDKKPVLELKKENFQIFEAQKSLEIDKFISEDEPTAIAILIDVSGSVTKEVRVANANAALKFIQISNAQNDYALIAFNDEVYPLTQWGSSNNQIAEELNKIAEPEIKGNTNLFSACLYAIDKLQESKVKRKVMLLFSDGVDNNPAKLFSDLRQKILETDVQIYSISLLEKINILDMQGQSFLDEITQRSGGKSFFIRKESDVLATVENLVEIIKAQYSIETNFPLSENKVRKLTIRLTDAKGTKLPYKVIAKNRYLLN